MFLLIYFMKERIKFYHYHITRCSDALFSSSRAKPRGVILFLDPLSLSLTIGFLLYFDSDSDSQLKIPIAIVSVIPENFRGSTISGASLPERSASAKGKQGPPLEGGGQMNS